MLTDPPESWGVGGGRVHKWEKRYLPQEGMGKGKREDKPEDVSWNLSSLRLSF